MHLYKAPPPLPSLSYCLSSKIWQHGNDYNRSLWTQVITNQWLLVEGVILKMLKLLAAWQDKDAQGRSVRGVNVFGWLNLKSSFFLMNRSAGLPNHYNSLHVKDLPVHDCGWFLQQWMFTVHPLAWPILLQCFRPSVYLSFILETQAGSKWINKDWAKIGSGCVCSVGHVGRLSALTASLSQRIEWRRGAAKLAGR